MYNAKLPIVEGGTGLFVNDSSSNVNLCTIGEYYWNNYYPVFYPCTTTIQYEDKFKKAIKIAEGLMKSKILKCENIGKFIEIVNYIAGEL